MEVLQTLDDVPLQAAGIGHDLRHGVDTGALQRHAAGHDEADVAAAENHHVPAGHKALHIHQTLGRTGGIDARRAGAGDVQRTTGALPAAHGQNDGLRLNLHEARLPAGDGQHPVRGQVQHHGARQTGDVQLPELPHILSGVLRAGELPAEGMQAKACMDTLIQNTAQLPIPLDEEDILHPGFPGGNGGGQARRASADDGKLHLLHACTSFVSPVSRRLPPPDLVSCVWGTPSSSDSSSMTRGAQKPP